MFAFDLIGMRLPSVRLPPFHTVFQQFLKLACGSPALLVGQVSLRAAAIPHVSPDGQGFLPLALLPCLLALA